MPAVDGGSVTLTIDASIQSFAEKAAREAMAVNNAKSVRVLVMQPQTGEILALVCKPDYDLNDPPRDDVETLTELMRNTVVSDAYEPGSTFKILTAAAALDAGVTHVKARAFTAPAPSMSRAAASAAGASRTAPRPWPRRWRTPATRCSWNWACAWASSAFTTIMERFGIGSATGVDIPGEGSGIVIDESVVDRVDLARIGFGQSVAVTPIQLLTAACSVVNGGKLLKPYVVKEIRAEDGEVIERRQTVVRGQTISRETSATMRRLLQNVVTDGGGRNAYIEGYRVGGKTGTAQVYVDGAISTDKHIGSFLGFAPMDDPQIAVLFIVDEADVPVDYGSTTAAPFARDVLEQSLIYLGVAPETDAEPLKEVPVPDVTGLPVSEAVEALKAAGLAPRALRHGRHGGRPTARARRGNDRGLAGHAIRRRRGAVGRERPRLGAGRHRHVGGGGQPAAALLRAANARRGQRRGRFPVARGARRASRRPRPSRWPLSRHNVTGGFANEAQCACGGRPRRGKNNRQCGDGDRVSVRRFAQGDARRAVFLHPRPAHGRPRPGAAGACKGRGGAGGGAGTAA